MVCKRTGKRQPNSWHTCKKGRIQIQELFIPIAQWLVIKKNSNLPSSTYCFMNLFSSSVCNSHDILGEYRSKKRMEEGKDLLFSLSAAVLKYLPKFSAKSLPPRERNPRYLTLSCESHAQSKHSSVRTCSSEHQGGSAPFVFCSQLKF